MLPTLSTWLIGQRWTKMDKVLVRTCTDSTYAVHHSTCTWAVALLVSLSFRLVPLVSEMENEISQAKTHAISSSCSQENSEQMKTMCRSIEPCNEKCQWKKQIGGNALSPIAMSSETNVSATLSGDTETRFSVVGKGLALLEASALCQHQLSLPK